MHFIKTFLVLLFFGAVGGINRPNPIELLDNGYRNILIAIKEDVKENSALIDNIKQSFRNASRFLYHATKCRAYFKHIKILLPSSWSDDPSYTRACNETFDNADIIVVHWRLSETMDPFVSNPECGMPGGNMQLTDKYFLDPISIYDYGPREKLLVHEWAHLQWGVHDEYPHAGAKQFYYSSETKAIEPVRCTLDIRGEIKKYSNATQKFIKCKLHGGRYAEGCLFHPFENRSAGVNASLMYRQHIDSIQFFCDDKNHNKEAVNQHNARCSKRSVWDVITSTPDFAGGKNPPRTISDADLMPTFTVLKDHQRPVVFVLDESESMKDQNKMMRMIQAVTKLIRSELMTGSYIGVVMFSSSARVLVPLTQLNSPSAREQIIRQLPMSPDGIRNTSIGSGLKEAVEMLGTAKGAIILVSDGQENINPTIECVMAKVLSACVLVHSVAFTNASDSHMSGLSTTTGGKFYYDSNVAGSNNLDSAMTDIAKELNRISSGSRANSQASQSFSMSRRVGKGATMTQTAYLNEGLGLNTRLVITYVSKMPSFKVMSPSGRVCNVTSPETVVDYRTKTINVLIPGIAETGQWLFTVTNVAASVSEDFGLSFASSTTATTDIMVLKAFSNVVEGVWPPKWTIGAVVKRGNLPVTGLNVTATIDRPGASPIYLKLRDDGIGADLRKKDGIYSRYFTQFTAKGRYSISLSAVAYPSQCSVMKMNPSQDAEKTHKMHSIPVSSGVSLATSGGALEFNPPSDKEILLRRRADIFAPGRIIDLQVVATDPDTPSVTLIWTATGDDMDRGTATKYNMFVNITIAGAKTSKVIEQSDLLLGKLTHPKSSGEAERFIVRVPYDGVRNTSYVFRVTATDDAGHTGDDSTPAAAGLGWVPPLIEITSDGVTTPRTRVTTPRTRVTTPRSRFTKKAKSAADITSIDVYAILYTTFFIARVILSR